MRNGKFFFVSQRQLPQQTDSVRLRRRTSDLGRKGSVGSLVPANGYFFGWQAGKKEGNLPPD